MSVVRPNSSCSVSPDFRLVEVRVFTICGLPSMSISRFFPPYVIAVLWPSVCLPWTLSLAA